MSDVLGSSRLCSQFATLNLAEREGGNEPSHRSAFRAQRTLAIGIFRSVKTLTSMEVQALAETPGTAGTPAAAQLHPEGPLPLTPFICSSHLCCWAESACSHLLFA